MSTPIDLAAVADAIARHDDLPEPERAALYRSAGYLPDWDPFGGEA